MAPTCPHCGTVVEPAKCPHCGTSLATLAPAIASPTAREDVERQRLAALAGLSQETDEIQCEMVYGTKWVKLTISALAAQHLTGDQLFDQHLDAAFTALGLPERVRADPETGPIDPAPV